MALSITDNTAHVAPNSDDISIAPNIDYDIPSRSNAFNALGRVGGTKKSLKDQIRDAKAIIDLPLDPKLYPKIQGPSTRTSS
ncbi:hypothetical protein QBC36DRAFT_28460 [Triangularia setosa]|uniref:Uncharacterized protein n=1 Tax=Triangularia setosa TaxID=2587417 RepID=A0AAN6W6L7_9PEZI|nr:hypothetical protein QBC36DRAFT_28460 [Podospora setosa]